jgi:hypothetical protein
LFNGGKKSAYETYPILLEDDVTSNNKDVSETFLPATNLVVANSA